MTRARRAVTVRTSPSRGAPHAPHDSSCSPPLRLSWPSPASPQAAIPNADGTINACVRGDGVMRVIDGATSTCKATEKPLKLTSKGPAGPAGTVNATVRGREGGRDARRRQEHLRGDPARRRPLPVTFLRDITNCSRQATWCASTAPPTASPSSKTPDSRPASSWARWTRPPTSPIAASTSQWSADQASISNQTVVSGVASTPHRSASSSTSTRPQPDARTGSSAGAAPRSRGPGRAPRRGGGLRRGAPPAARPRRGRGARRWSRARRRAAGRPPAARARCSR